MSVSTSIFIFLFTCDCFSAYVCLFFCVSLLMCIYLSIAVRAGLCTDLKNVVQFGYYSSYVLTRMCTTLVFKGFGCTHLALFLMIPGGCLCTHYRTIYILLELSHVYTIQVFTKKGTGFY